jgi:hypothetical protein
MLPLSCHGSRLICTYVFQSHLDLLRRLVLKISVVVLFKLFDEMLTDLFSIGLRLGVRLASQLSGIRSSGSWAKILI